MGGVAGGEQVDDGSGDILRGQHPVGPAFLARVAAEVLGTAPAVNMRVGGSDSRWYRPAGVPTVVLGLTPFNMGGPDEYVLVDELLAVAKIHTLTAFDFLTGA